MEMSIIIPTYNEAANLRILLPYLVDLCADKKITIAVADSPLSDDDSGRVCSRYEMVDYMRCPGFGRAKQMNYGAFKSRGDVLLFLHADVRPPFDFCEQVFRVISGGYKMGFFAYRFDRERWLLRVNSHFTTRDGFFAGGGDQCQFFSREVFESLGGYDEQYCIMEDFHMIDRIRKAQIPYTVIPSKALVSARKYEAHSWLKVNLINLYVFLRYKWGTPPDHLRQMYRSLLREGL